MKGRILVGCESSGRVRDAFRARGFDAWSCDYLPCEGDPRYHIQGDVMDAVEAQHWDCFIVHPSCTFLCSSGLHWNKRRPERAQETERALEFVRRLLGVNVKRIALENPVGCISTRIRKYDQKIHPWWFGDDASKGTCLWLKNLPKLVATNEVPPKYGCAPCRVKFPLDLGKHGCPDCGGLNGDPKKVWGNQTASGQNALGPSEDRWRERSRTYNGIAEAMADQWGQVIAEECEL